MLDILNLIVSIIVPITATVVGTHITIGKSRKNFEKEMKIYNCELEKRVYEFTRGYDFQVEAIREINYLCAKIWCIFNRVLPIEASDRKIKWEEKIDISDYVSDIAYTTSSLRKTVQEYYPFIGFDLGLVNKLIELANKCIKQLNYYIDTMDNDKQSHVHSSDVKDTAFNTIKEYEKTWNELNEHMKQIMRSKVYPVSIDKH